MQRKGGNRGDKGKKRQKRQQRGECIKEGRKVLKSEKGHKREGGRCLTAFFFRCSLISSLVFTEAITLLLVCLHVRINNVFFTACQPKGRLSA